MLFIKCSFITFPKVKNLTLDNISTRPKAIIKLQVCGTFHASKHLKLNCYYLLAYFNLPSDFLNSTK